MERCVLSEKGLPVLYCSARGANGGDWQAFAYDSMAEAWTRVADMRHLLSSAFGAGPIPGLDTPLATMHSEIVRENGFGAREVLPIAKALRAASGSTSSSSNANTLARSAEEDPVISPTMAWVNVATLAHLEDRLCVASAVGNQQELNSWLANWVAFCMKSGLGKRVQWVVSQLQLAAANANVTAGASADSQWGWLERVSVSAPEKLIQEVILPALARSGLGTDLISEISEAMDIIREL